MRSSGFLFLLVFVACSPDEQAIARSEAAPPSESQAAPLDPCALGSSETVIREAGQLLGSPLLLGHFDLGPSHFWHVAQVGEGGWLRIDWYRPDSMHWVSIPATGEPTVYNIQPYRVCTKGGLFTLAGRSGDPAGLTVLLPRPPIQGEPRGTQRVLWRTADNTWRESAEVTWVSDPLPELAAAGSPNAATPVDDRPLIEQSRTPNYDIRAVIQDPDGFTNVRSGPSLNDDVVARVYLGEIFETFRQDGSWWQVRTKDGVVGFMHVSRISWVN
jgi:hypothetical protein